MIISTPMVVADFEDTLLQSAGTPRFFKALHPSNSPAPATHAKLGGNVPSAVKTWMMNNVHTIGYDPHNRRDAGGPRTGVGGH